MPQFARTFHSACTDTRKVTTDPHAQDRAARARARRLEGALARCSHTRPHEAHWASTHVPPHPPHGGADTVLPRIAAGLESTRRGPTAVRQSCALGSGAGTRRRRRLGYGTRTAVGAMVRLPHYSQGTRKGTRGVLTGPCVERSARGSGRGRARHLQRGRAEHELPRGYCKIYRVPHGAGPLRGVLPAYSRPRVASVRAQRCDGACTRTQGCLRTRTVRRARHARARRGIARAAGAQITQQLERRQRGGDRAVELVRTEIPATCMVHPAGQ